MASQPRQLTVISIGLLLMVIAQTVAVSQESLVKLRALLEVNPLLDWIHKDAFATVEKLDISYHAVNLSQSHTRPLAPRIRNLIYKGLEGEVINVGILGGSISAGATLYNTGDQRKVYFRALSEWWNQVIAAVTMSRMSVHNYAIGATGSDFYSYCLDNYAHSQQTDFVIWELSANDYHRFDNRDVPPTMPMELLTRRVLRMESKPAVVYVNFFRGKDYAKEGDCNNLENDGVDYLSRYYSIASISWRKLVCRKLIIHGNATFTKIFGPDWSHPSVLGHAQVGFLLIEYVRQAFIDVIDELLLEGPAFAPANQLLALPIEETSPLQKPVFRKALLVAENPICFTFNLPSDGSQPRNHLLHVHVLKNDGFAISVAHGFIVRKDKTRGLRARSADKTLHLSIDVPQQTSPDIVDWMILIGSYSNFGGAVFFIDGRFSRVIETQKYAYGSIVAAVATHVKPGHHTLTIKTLKRGFFISSIMLG